MSHRYITLKQYITNALDLSMSLRETAEEVPGGMQLIHRNVNDRVCLYKLVLLRPEDVWAISFISTVLCDGHPTEAIACMIMVDGLPWLVAQTTIFALTTNQYPCLQRSCIVKGTGRALWYARIAARKSVQCLLHTRDGSRTIVASSRNDTEGIDLLIIVRPIHVIIIARLVVIKRASQRRRRR